MIWLFNELYIDESGATAIEYGLIAVVVSVAAIGAMLALGTSVNNTFTSVSNDVATVSGSP